MNSVYKSFNYPAVTAEAAKSMGMTADEFEQAKRILGRTPNYIELGCISAMFSEHCSYKSSRLHLKKLPSKGEHVVYGPGENAGVVSIDGDLCICFKVESHNHPSFIEPFNGSATGVGGILRDVFTMGARPIAAMNSLRFGDPKHRKTAGLVRGVVDGISHYGNCFGVPTVGGEVYFNSCYDGNPLVNAFALGLVKRDKIFTANAEGVGNPVLYIGAKTGRDGIHGATMASEEFSEGSESKRPNTQIGDPFKEKLLLEACLELMQTDALVGIQDMGAAGLTSSAFEMAGRAGSGVIMHLDKVPLREDGITPYEIMLSESQERMLLVAQKGREQEIIDIVQKWDLDAAAIGEVTDDGYVRLFWSGVEVAAVEAAPLSDQAPMYDRPYARPAWLDKLADFDEKQIPLPRDFDNTVLRLASDISIASKRWIWEQYDHMVQVGTVVLPGSDAAVLRINESKKGLALSSDCNSRYCYLNPREGAMHAVAESARNVAASGAMPLALTNCLNYGNPEKPEVMYQLVEGIEGIAEAAKALDTPVVSGNVSLYNETEGKPIYPTPVIVITGVLEDVERRLDISFKRKDSHILAIGKLPASIGGSHYLDVIHNTVAGKIPAVDLPFHKKLFAFMTKMAGEGQVLAAHDIAEGGIAIALFEMGRANNIGCAVTLPATARADALLFGEAPLMLLEVSADNYNAVVDYAKQAGLDCTDIGNTTDDGLLSMHTGSISHIKTEISKLDAVYEKALVELVKPSTHQAKE